MAVEIRQCAINKLELKSNARLPRSEGERTSDFKTVFVARKRTRKS